MFGLVDEWQDSCQHTDTIERIAVRSSLWVWERGMVLEDVQAGSDCQNECLEILNRGVARPSYICRREKAEDIFNRLWQFPKL